MENENNSGWRAVGTILAQVILGAVCAAGGWIGCGMYDAHAKKNAGAVQAPPAAAPTVSVAEVLELPYNLPERYVAHAEALQEVDLLPQVDGYVKEIKFKEGDIVAAGQELYILDDERYQAIVGQRKADLAAAQAEKDRADRYFKRMQEADARGITQLERDNAEAAALSAAAKVKQAEANLVVAAYDLKKARVVAPISGQIGKTAAHVGDYVAPSKGALARIVQVDPIRVSFPLTDRAYVAWRAAQKAGRAIDYRTRILLPDGSAYDREGAFDFDDNQMSLETATIMMRLKFPNPDRLLVPNSYVTLLADRKDPLTYPTVQQTAVIDLPTGGVGVYVLRDNGTVEAVPVETLPAHDGLVPVTKGLAAGAKVVVAGTRKLVSGMKVAFAEATKTEENAADYEPFKL